MFRGGKMPRHKKYLDDLMANEPLDGRLKLELRKLSNSDGWVSTTARESSASSSRASTPQSHASSVIGNSSTPTAPKRGRPRKNPYPNLSDVKKKKKKGRPRLDKPKHFKMVLEKDDDFEVDYITPDEDESDSQSEPKDSVSFPSLSDEEHFLDNEEQDVSSIEGGISSSMWLDEEEAIEEEDIPVLELPESSDDLLIERKLVMPALAVYETLRHFRNNLRLSPMLFEDFCAAIATKDTTVLLNECHITLLRALLKEEDHIGTTFVPPDQKDAYSVAFYFLDHLTWPEVLHYYVESSPEYKDILPIVENKDFPSVEPQQKIEVLQFLTNLYLSSTKIRDELMMDGTIHYDDHCRVCHRLGDLLCCETCPAVYHLACCNPPLKEVPEDEWQCGVCVAHQLNGVTNCESEQETNGQYLRHDPIGVDRHGRKYWFLARRLIVEGGDDTHYYTTVEEFEYLKNRLDPDKWEMTLCEALVDVAEEFPRHAEVTEHLTNKAKWSEHSVTQIDNLKNKVQKAIEEEAREAEEQRKLEELKRKEQEEEERKIREQAEEEKRKQEEALKEEDAARKNMDIDADSQQADSTSVEEQPVEDGDAEKNKDECDKMNTEEDTSQMDQSVPEPVVKEVAVETVEDLAEPESKDTEIEGVSASETVAESASLDSKPADVHAENAEMSDRNIKTEAELTNSDSKETIAETSLQSESTPKPLTATVTNEKATVPILPKSQPSPQVVKLLPKQQNLWPIKLANIKVPLSRCDAMVNTSASSVKTQAASAVTVASSSVQQKNASSVTSLRTLFVLGKDGARTPITIGPGGKIITPQKFLLINSQQNANKTPKTDKVSRELKKLQFSGAGPKMHKIGVTGSVTNSPNLNKGATLLPNTHAAASIPKINKPPFKLGEDEGYKRYKNHYVENTLALNKYQHKEDKDKDRHVGYKFSIGGPVEFEWAGELCGSRDEIVHTLRSALFRFEQQIPLCFMHSKWEQYRKMWGRMLLKNDSSRAFAVVLGILEMAIRDNVKKTVWKDAMGQSRMRRLLTAEKESYEKKKKNKTKAEEDIANRKAVWCKYPLPIRSMLVWKMKGEEYRITGYGGWMWISSSFKLMEKPYKPKPYTLVSKSRTQTGPKTEKEPKESADASKTAEDDDAAKTEKQENEDKSKESKETKAEEEVVDDAKQAEDLAAEVKGLVAANEVIDVSKNLLVRSVLYDRKWQTTNLDKLLRWRILQEKQHLINSKALKSLSDKAKTNGDLDSKPVNSPAPKKVDGEDLEISDDDSKPKVEDAKVKKETVSTKLDCEVKTEPMETEETTKSSTKSNGNATGLNEGESTDTGSECEKLESPKKNGNTVTTNHEVTVKSEPTNEESSDKLTNNNLHEENLPVAVEPVNGGTDVDIDDSTTSSHPAKNNNDDIVDHEKSARATIDHDTTKNHVSKGDSPQPEKMDVDTTKPSSPPALCNGVDSPETITQKKLMTSTTVTTTTTETIVVNANAGESSQSTTDVSLVTTTTTTQSTTVETVSKVSSPKPVPKTEPKTENDSLVPKNEPSQLQNEKLTTSIDINIDGDPEGVIKSTYDSVIKSSSVRLDHKTGEVLGKTVHRQLSRRFRTVKKPGGTNKVVQSSSSESTTCRSWKLKRSPGDSSKKKNNEIKMPIPWKFSYGRGRKKNIFRLPSVCIKNLAQRGGIAWNPKGFHLTLKWPSMIDLFWPYPCPRPTIGTVWRYKVQNATTLAAIAHLLRVLWHSIRWDDMVTSPSQDDMVHVVHTDENIITTELLRRRDSGSSGLHSEYYVRRIRVPTSEYDEEIPYSEAYTPSSRSGLRTRTRPIGLRERTRKDGVNNPRVETLWLPENEIELWQIRQFHTMLRSQQKNNHHQHNFSSSVITPSAKIRLTPQERVISLTQPPSRSTPLSSKNVTITPALLQQAAALHKQQINVDAKIQDQAIKKLILNKSGDNAVLRLPESKVQPATPFRTITIKNSTQPHTQFIALKSVAPSTPTSGNTFIQVSGGQALIKSGSQYIMQGNKMLPGRQIIFKQSLLPSSSTPSIQPKTVSVTSTHPTIRLASKPSTPTTPQTPQKPKTSSPAQQATPTSSKSSRMQVTLSSNQLNQLMRVGTDTRVRVSIKLSDGKPGIGQLQVIPAGVQVTPAQGQQLMQCKVGNEVRKFLLTAISEKAPTAFPSTPASPIPTPLSPQTPVAANEVSVETPSLKHRLLQLQQRHHGLMRQPEMDVKQLMTDKDPLWGGRPQLSDKPVIYERQIIKRDMVDRARKRQSITRENREGQQRRAVVQQLMKSILDKIERKEELEARRKKKEEHIEQQKKKKESMDEAKSQQRLHHRLIHALRKHEDQIKQEIRKRRAITEKYITRVVENELYEDQVKYGKRRHIPIASSTPMSTPGQTSYKRQRKTSSHFTTDKLYGNVLAESNRRKSSSPKKSSAKDSRKRELPSDHQEDFAPVAKKKKMISTSTKLYCVCKTPYDETKFYIGCDLCMNWFHGVCVGISEKKAKAMETWVCQDCAKEQSAPQQELYCFCRTPYDDAKFYIGCDVCQDWYHGSCVGISEEEASGIESYTCPRCKQDARDASQEGTLSDRDYFNLTKIVRHLQGHKMAWPFLEPVREEDAPNYYRVVKRPMDIQTVLKRLECRYYMKLSELVGDVSLIFDNCRQYNGADSKIVRCAEFVESVFVGKIRDLRGRRHQR